MSPRSSTGLVVALAALAAVMPARAFAAAPAQQRCVAVVERHGLQVMVAAGRAALACARVAASAREGFPPGARAGATQECLGAGVERGLATQVRRLERAEVRWCSGADQRPEAGVPAARAVADAARTAGVGVVVAVLGDALAMLPAPDSAGGRCQLAVAAGAVRLAHALWADGVRPWPHAVAGATRRLERDTRRACGRVAPPLAGLFALPCADLTTPAALAGCAAGVARTHVYRGWAAAYGRTIPCDLSDDGTANLSCVPPALEEHVLNRLGYGPDADSLARLRALGVRGYVAEQLRPATIADDALDAMLQPFPSLGMSFLDLRIHYPNRVVPGQPQSGDVLKELQRAKVLRAIASRRQLEQVLVDFWFNHFNILATDRRDYDISPYERLAIRPHVLGRFRDLLLAVARSPGMGDFLDGRRNRADGLNENFARELLELHTVGVESGFTEADVAGVARAFTGWKENQSTPDGFEFLAAWHDREPKQVLGLALPAGGGYEDGLAVIDLLATHPSTAARVARKLVVRFVAETPPPDLVAAATATFLATGGDLRAVMETILLSPEILAEPAYRRSKVKRPLHLLASLARATHADPATLNLDRIRRRIRELGEDLYGFPAPSGYPDVSAYWTGAGTMLLRFNFAELAVRGVDGIQPAFPPAQGGADALVEALIADLFVAGVSAATRDTAVAFVDLLGSAGQPGRQAAAAAVLLSSPEFLVH